MTEWYDIKEKKPEAGQLVEVAGHMTTRARYTPNDKNEWTQEDTAHIHAECTHWRLINDSAKEESTS